MKTIIICAALLLVSSLTFAQVSDSDRALLQQLERLQAASTGSPTPAATRAGIQARQAAPTAPTTVVAQAQVATTVVPQTNFSTVSGDAFAEVVNNALPLTPEQIKLLKTLFNASQRVAAEFPGTPPKPISTTQIVNLSPGATPPVVRLGAGFVTSIVFVDATGSPWPIQAYDLGDPRAFNVQWDKKGNTLLVQAVARYKTGNLAVILKDLNTPIMITLMPGQKAIDYRVDMRIPGLGPEAQLNHTGLPSPVSPVMLNVLNGVPPTGSKRVNVDGCNQCQAWLINQKLYLRTRYTVLSPGWIATMSSADGTRVYVLPKTPVVLAARHGKTVKFLIEGH